MLFKRMFIFLKSFLRTFYNGMVNNIWIYPLLNILNLLQLTIVFTISTFIVIGFYKMGEIMNSIFWNDYEIREENLKKFQ